MSLSACTYNIYTYIDVNMYVYVCVCVCAVVVVVVVFVEIWDFGHPGVLEKFGPFFL